MKKWNKQDAVSALEGLINEIPVVADGSRKSAIHTRWLANSLRILEEVFGPKSRYYLTLAHFSWSETGRMIVSGWDPESEIERRHQQAFRNQMDQALGLINSAIDHLKQSEITDVYEGKNTAQEASELMKIITLAEKKLRQIVRTIPDKEKEVQDKYEDLLIANDIEYSKEFPHIEYSSKQYVPDFSFSRINLAVEIKLCKNDEKILIGQINDDILAYKTQFSNLLFIIYDLGQIRDIETFKRSFESNDDVIIQVIKH